MTGSSHTSQHGFSAVELLITLFVAAAFIATGYQLYTVVVKSGGEARTQAIASNLAYNTLRTYSAQTVNPCAASNPAVSVPANSGLPTGATMTVAITCPFGAVRTSKVTVSVNYNTPQRTVTHALFVSN